MRYEYAWQNHWLTSEARTLGDMINALLGAVETLQLLEERGVALDPDSGIADDQATLFTEDPKVAEAFGFTADAERGDGDDDDPEGTESPSDHADPIDPQGRDEGRDEPHLSMTT